MPIVDDRQSAGVEVAPKPPAPAERPVEPKPRKRRGSWLRWATILGGTLVLIALVLVIALTATTADDDPRVLTFEGAAARTPTGFVPTGWVVPEGPTPFVPEPIAPRLAMGFSPSGWEAPDGSLVVNELLAPEPRLPDGFVPAGG